MLKTHLQHLSIVRSEMCVYYLLVSLATSLKPHYLHGLAPQEPVMIQTHTCQVVRMKNRERQTKARALTAQTFLNQRS